MRRLFASPLPGAGGRVELSGATAHHARVLRLAVGDSVCLFDGAGLEARGRVVEAGTTLVCEVGTPRRVEGPTPRVVLVQALPRAGKLDGIVRMATELGVAAVHLAIAEHSVARGAGPRASSKVERLRRVAREAARQSRRAHVPEVVAPAPLAEVAARAPAGAARLLLYEHGAEPLPERLEGAGAWLIVGPEGGIAEAEAARLIESGYAPLSLGPAILRVQTAAVVAVALALDRMGGLRPRIHEGFSESER